MKKPTLNDADREQWINNDEGLYNWWKRSGLPMRKFIKANREELTRLILATMNRIPGVRVKGL